MKKPGGGRGAGGQMGERINRYKLLVIKQMYGMMTMV